MSDLAVAPGRARAQARERVAAPQARLRAMFDAHYDLVWRTVRRMGLPGSSADEAAQDVFVVAWRKLDRIERGKERAFLIGTAIRIASDARKARARRPDVVLPEQLDGVRDPGPALDELVDRRRARQLLDDVLVTLPANLRVVFALFELESMTTPEIAAVLDIPAGTVASRVRRAREAFRAAVHRLRAERLRREAG